MFEIHEPKQNNQD